MSFVRDPDARTRSVGAIAAVDHASPRGSRIRALRARQLAEQDRAIARFTRSVARPMSMGATNANNYGGLTGAGRRPQISSGGAVEQPPPPTLGTRPPFVPSAGIPGSQITPPPTGPKFLSTRYAAQVQKVIRQGQTLQTAPQELTPLNTGTGTGTPNTTVIVDPGPDGRVDPNTGIVDTGGGSTTTTGGGGGSTWGGGGGGSSGGGGGGLIPDTDPGELVTATAADAPMSTGTKIALGLGVAALAYYLYKEGV